MRPVEWPAVQVHHGLDENILPLQTVNDGVGKAAEVKLAIVSSDFAPALRLAQDLAKCDLVFIQKVGPQTRLALIVPKGGGFQLLRHIRMSEDAHGAYGESPEPFRPPGGHPRGPPASRGSVGQ